VASYLGTDEGLREVCDEIAEALAAGVAAVPTFVFDGRYVVEGGQPAPTLLRALEEVARLRRPAPPRTGEVSLDACADGACRV
jgi:predicted DsbA family dithiol-disulfide isomerase